MTITEAKKGSWLVLALTERLDTQTAPELEKEAMGKLTQGCKLALDLTELDYISSAGLRVLLMLMKKAKPQGGNVVLVGTSGMVREVIEESGIDSFFDFYEKAEALP